MHRRVLTAAGLALVVVACQPDAIELTEQREAAIAEELTRLYAQSLVTIRELDQEGWLAYFQDSEDFTLAANGAVFRSHAALADTLSAQWAELAMLDGDWGELHIQVLAPNVAVVTSAFEFAATDTVGTSMTFNGTWTAVWVEQDGNWKMVNVAESFPPAEAEPEGT